MHTCICILLQSWSIPLLFCMHQQKHASRNPDESESMSQCANKAMHENHSKVCSVCKSRVPCFHQLTLKIKTTSITFYSSRTKKVPLRQKKLQISAAKPPDYRAAGSLQLLHDSTHPPLQPQTVLCLVLLHNPVQRMCFSGVRESCLCKAWKYFQDSACFYFTTFFT